MTIDLKDITAPTFIQTERNHKLPNKVFVVNSLGKGGSGKSLFASNLASGYRMLGYSVVICDFCLPYGDQAALHGLPEDISLMDWLKAPVQLQKQLTDKLLIETKDGIKLLPSPQHIQEQSMLNHQWLAKKIINNLADYDVVIIDTSYFNDLTIGAMEEATEIFLLSETDSISQVNLKKGMHFLLEQNISTDKLVLILNKVLPRIKADSNQFLSMGINRFYEIPYESKMHKWIEDKIFPIRHKPKSKIAKSLNVIIDDFKPNKSYKAYENVGSQ